MGLKEIGLKIEKAIYIVSRGIRVFSISALFIMMLFGTVGVIGRYIFNKPVKGDIELHELMMVVIIFTAMAYATTMKQHVFVELLVAKLKGRALAVANSIALFFSLIILSLIVWRMALVGWRELLSPTGKYTVLLGVPVAPFILLADAGLFLMTLVFLCQFIRQLTALFAFRTTGELSVSGVKVK